MQVEEFVKILDSDFFTGVPDSLLAPLSAYLMEQYGIDGKHHVIAVNEGNAVGMAAGNYLATGKIPVVYMQNSGQGNAINPIASLLNDNIYAIPVIFVIGWRGEPGVEDEPQHKFQGQITKKLTDVMDIFSFVISRDTTVEEIQSQMKVFEKLLEQGKSVAFIVKKGALNYENKHQYTNNYQIVREQAIEKIISAVADDLVVSTTGKISRELFECRERRNESHDKDFLTVGSMGHSSSIAYSLAAASPERRVWCLDGDGAFLMHMGATAIIGSSGINNFVHVVFNNSAHESVGGMPTVANKIDMLKIAGACGYTDVYAVNDMQQLDQVLNSIANIKGLIFIEIKCSMQSRADLGRPTITPLEGKINFMRNWN